ncbi:MAG: alginate lyase family protein [Anaerolineae bacterium]
MFTHCGLYFGDEQIAAARKERGSKPLKQAWARLPELQPADDIAAVIIGGFLYRFDDNSSAGMHAAAKLYNAPLPADSTLNTFRTLAALAQGHEMLRPLFSAEEQTRWQTDFAAHLGTLRTGALYHEQLWYEALRLLAGIVLEQRAWVEAGAEVYRRVIREDIRPDGYIQEAVEGRDGEGFFRHIVSTQALVLMAEAARHVGIDLWGYEQRGVSVVTAAAYPLYYYFYPQKWRWDKDLSEDTAQRIFRDSGGFLEMVNHQRPLHDIGLLLKEWRPVCDIYGGGLTTLSHGGTGKRGLFGR